MTVVDVVTGAGERLGVGDRVMTRRNDRDLAVANRDTWTITGIDPDGTLTVHGDARTGSRSLPAGYVHEHVELAYATTVHGAQGETTHTGHLLLGEHTTAAAAYVAMTRGREDNVAHLVAEDLDDARQQWIETFGRDRADLGPAHAARRAAEDLERYAPHRPLEAALGDLRAAWTTEQDLRDALARCESRYDFMAADGDLPQPGPPTTAPRWTSFVTSSPPPPTRCAPSSTNPPSGPCHRARIEQEHADWLQDRQPRTATSPSRLGDRALPPAQRPTVRSGYPSPPDRGRGISR